MGILQELFSKPIYGKNGELGDAALPRQTGYARYSDDTFPLSEWDGALPDPEPMPQPRQFAPAAQTDPFDLALDAKAFDDLPHVAAQVAQAASPEVVSRFRDQTLPKLLRTYSTLAAATPDDLRMMRVRDKHRAMSAIDAALDRLRGPFRLPDHLFPAAFKDTGYVPRPNPNVRKPKPHLFANPVDPTPYWTQAPTAANIGGRPYRAGQFLPGTAMFTHTPRRQEAINPEAPIPYSPLMEPGATQQQPDGTHAMPLGPNANQYIPGAPQSVGGEPLAVPGQPAAQPGQPVPQGPSDMPPPQTPQAGPQGQNGQPQPNVPVPVPQGPQPFRTPGLNPQDAVLEAQSQMFAWTNYGALRDAYFTQNAVVDPVSGDVRSLIINQDQFNQFIPGFTGTNGAAVKQAAGWLSDQLFREALQNQTGKGNNTFMVLADGASGEGTQDYLEAAEYPLVMEQPARNYEKLNEQFERARAAGMKPAYQYVDRPAGEGLQSAIEDALADRLAGRPVNTQPLESIARANMDARRTTLEVLFRSPDVDAAVIDHHGGQKFQRRMLTDRNEAAMYLAQRLAEDERNMPHELERVKQDLIARQKKGEIPVDVVTGMLGQGWGVRPPAPRPGHGMSPGGPARLG